VIVLNFHRVERPTGLEINRIRPDRFARFLDVIGESGLVVGKPGRDPLKVMPEVLITFDDGFASINDHALPMLQDRGWGAVIFLISGFVGCNDDWDVRILGRRRPLLTWSQVKAWSDAGFVFGSHSHTHRDLTALTPASLTRELLDSKREIEDATGRDVTALSYPFGRHNERVRDAVRDAGYDAAFAVNGSAGDRFAIPRVNIHSLMTIRELRSILMTDPKPTWPTRLFTSLSAGSATVGNWRGSQTDSESHVRTSASAASVLN
jgi:peptidoglycan/xylan/chitin deacetylase (PgdA/CDA1 family)